jgi:hypothetical protein
VERDGAAREAMAAQEAGGDDRTSGADGADGAGPRSLEHGDDDVAGAA